MSFNMIDLWSSMGPMAKAVMLILLAMSLLSLAIAIEPLIARYREAGLVVTTDLYPDARHEVFNETNRAEVVERFAAWLGTVRRRTRP